MKIAKTKKEINPDAILLEEFDIDQRPSQAEFLKSLYKPLILILSVTAILGIGKLNVLNATKPDITIENVVLQTGAQIGSNLSNEEGSGAQTNQADFIVGSKNGTKYHFENCPGFKQIKNENKIFFDTEASAITAGYTLAKNCSR